MAAAGVMARKVVPALRKLAPQIKATVIPEIKNLAQGVSNLFTQAKEKVSGRLHDYIQTGKGETSPAGLICGAIGVMMLMMFYFWRWKLLVIGGSVLAAVGVYKVIIEPRVSHAMNPFF